MLRVVNWDDIQEGDLGWYAGDGPLSKAIRRLTHRRDLDALGFKTPSHLFIVLNSTQVIEALEKTKVRAKLEYKDAFLNGRVYIYRPEATEATRKAALQEFYERFNNHPYGWLQILAFLPVLALRKVGLNSENLLPMGNICSEDGILYLRMLLRRLHNDGEIDKALALGWAVGISNNSIDPALMLICCIYDKLPLELRG